MEKMILILIGVAAAGIVIRRIYLGLTTKKFCSSDCSDCNKCKK